MFFSFSFPDKWLFPTFFLSKKESGSACKAEILILFLFLIQLTVLR